MQQFIKNKIDKRFVAITYKKINKRGYEKMRLKNMKKMLATMCLATATVCMTGNGIMVPMVAEAADDNTQIEYNTLYDKVCNTYTKTEMTKTVDGVDYKFTYCEDPNSGEAFVIDLQNITIPDGVTELQIPSRIYGADVIGIDLSLKNTVMHTD